MNWATFKNLVRGYLSIHSNRQGTQDTIDKWIRSAAVDLQRLIPALQAGHVNVFELSDFVVEGEALSTPLPAGTIQSVELFDYDAAASDLDFTTQQVLQQLPTGARNAARLGEAGLGFIIDVPAQKLTVTPAITAEQRITIRHNGVKSSFADVDILPTAFDEDAANVIAYYVLAHISRLVDRDDAAAQSFNQSYMGARQALHAQWNERRHVHAQPGVLR